jgi:putative glutamine amidotransferase
MKRPIIGIEADVGINPTDGRRFAKLYEAYYEAAYAAGGNPVILPPLDGPEHVERALEVAQAIVLTGGDDLPAEEYGEPTLKCERTSLVDGTRYRFGRALVKAAIEADRPLLGVCYGHQLLNVALGGALVQDIPIQLPGSLAHREEKEDANHDIEFVPGSRLARLAGVVKARVNSKHHQSVKTAGEGLKIVARAPDGIIEAVEGPGRFLVGVQWHPERMGPGKLGWGVFEALVEAARSASSEVSKGRRN